MNFDRGFSNWTPWEKRTEIPRLQFPGIYALAISEADISGTTYDWIQPIVYVGMSNAVAGLKGRLDQFDNTIRGKMGHGGAQRFFYKYPDRSLLVPQLYVAALPVECDPRSATPRDLRLMGEVAKLEYVCFAEFVERFGHLPEFNDKKRSPKHLPWPPRSL